MRVAVQSGLDRFLNDPDAWLGPRTRPWRTGILANPVAITRDYHHVVDACLAHPAFEVERLFGPEHGIRGEAQDMIEVGHGRDPISGLPVVSLYGATFDTLTPRTADLDGLDVLIIDLQDVGSRYYTFIATALLSARVALAAGVRVVVLDRPNPIADPVEGPSVDPGYESFVGLFALPIRHGLTMAEVFVWCRRFGGFFDKALPEPILVTCLGWKRSLYADETDLPWVLPSPNMPTVDTAVVYPGQCLVEGTHLSEGRGCTRPFEFWGAPWIRPWELLATLEPLDLPGLALRPMSFVPTFHKFAGERCSGLQLHVTNRNTFLPVLTSTALLWACRRLYPEFAWRTHAYEFVDTIPAIDLLYGSDRPRLAIDARADWAEVRALLQTPPDLLAQIQHVRFDAYGAP